MMPFVMIEISNPEAPLNTDKEETYMREMWALTRLEVWERLSKVADSHCSLAAWIRDHWLRTLRCAADLHSLSDEGDSDGEAAGGWDGRVGVAAEVSIATPTKKDFVLLLSPGPLGVLEYILDSTEEETEDRRRVTMLTVSQ